MARLRDTILFHDANLVAYWEAEDNANDSSGNGNNGTTTDISYVSAKYSKGFSLNGSSSFVDLGSVFRTFNTPFSIVAWIHPDAIASDYNIFGQISGTFPTDMQGFEYQISSSKQRLQLWNGGSNSSQSSTTNLSTAGLQHVAVTYDGTTVKFYLDGTADGSLSDSLGIKTAGADQNAAIGRRTWTSNMLYFDGIIDDIAIFSDVLTAAEIANLASATGTTTSTSSSTSTTTTSSSTSTTTTSSSSSSSSSSSTSTTTTSTSTSTTTTITTTSTTTTSSSTSSSSSSSTSTTTTSSSTSTTTTSSSTSSSSSSSTSTTTTMPMQLVVELILN